MDSQIWPEKTFGKEFSSWGKGKCLKSYSGIMKLDPFINDAEIKRVGGKIQRSSEIQHLVLLPESCRIAELLVSWWDITILQIKTWLLGDKMSGASSWEESFSNEKWQIFQPKKWVMNCHLCTLGLTCLGNLFWRMVRMKSKDMILRIWLNRSWFVIHDKVLNFHD